MSRKHVSTTETAFEALDAQRKADESWSELFERAAEALDGGVETGPETLTRDDVDDIAALTARRTADEAENRLTRR